MEVMDGTEIVETLENHRQVKYGTMFDRPITWKVAKFHKDNDTQKKKVYVVDGYYLSVFIGQAVLIVSEEGYIKIDFLNLDGRNDV